MAWTVRYVSVAGGGAHNGTTEADAWTLAEAIAAPYAAGQQINVKAGTYANTTTGLTFSVAGSTTAPIWWRGYKTTIGDLDDGVSVARSLQDGVNLPLITFTTGQMVLSGAHNIFSNLDITSQCTTTNGAVSATGGNLKFVMCRIENTAANVAARAITFLTTASNSATLCRFKATTTSSRAVTVSTNTSMHGCQIIGGIAAVIADNGMEAFDYCIVSGFATTGVECALNSGRFNLINCTIYAAATNCVNISTIPTTGHVGVINCILGGCTNGITAATSTNGITLLNNHFYGCTNNLVNITEVATVGDYLGILARLIDDDNDPFVNKATGDFTLASGAVDKSAGMPGIFEGQTAMVGHPDIGAVRHIDPTAGAGGRPEFRGSNL